MKKTLIALVPLALIAVIWVSPATGQHAPDTAAERVALELGDIRDSLDDLVRLLATMKRNQDADLMLRRIEMHERRLAPLEGRLDRNGREQQDVQTSIRNVEEWKSQTEERIHQIEREGREEIPLELLQEVRMAEQQIALEQDRLDRLRQQQIDLENTLADRRDDVEILEDLLRELVE